MINHNITIKQPYFDQIKVGIKSTEGRAGSMYEKIKIGDSITFVNGKDKIIKRIKAITKYKTLDDYLNSEGYQNCIPNAKNIQEAEQAYNKIPGYAEKISKMGIMGISFE